MNNFTKEELEELLGWGQELCNEHDTEWLPEEQALSKKLQFLIDNYPSTHACLESIRKYHELED